MSNETQKTFYVAVKFVKDGRGDLENDVNFKSLKKKIKDGISEAVGRSQGIINSYQIGEVEEA